MPRGSQSAALVASGDAGIVGQPTSELLHVPGLDFVGRIPAELQLIRTFAAAIAGPLPKLLAVKDKYDPEGPFFVHHGVGSERWSGDGFTRLGPV